MPLDKIDIVKSISELMIDTTSAPTQYGVQTTNTHTPTLLSHFHFDIHFV